MKKSFYLLIVIFIIIILVFFILLTGSSKKIDLNDSKTIDKIKQTNRIVIQVENKQDKTIEDKQNVNRIIRIILDSKKEKGFVNLEGTTQKMILYNKKGEVLFVIKVWNSGFFGLNSKDYQIQSKDLDTFIKIIEE
ncbi:MAG: hypothetical protein IKQ06_00285 [Bacilli bacterium]|nr:hypothetical protein [Bacilli bacterium]